MTIKPPERSPQRIRNEEDYGTKMMDYPDVNINNDMSPDIISPQSRCCRKEVFRLGLASMEAASFSRHILMVA